MTTKNANDLLVGANLVQTTTTGPGSGYTTRLITNPDSDILEDRVVTATGSYSATAPLTSGPCGSCKWLLSAQREARHHPLYPSAYRRQQPVLRPRMRNAGLYGYPLQNDSINKGVTWSLSGAGCSGSTCGTLSNVATTSVTYNGPANVPNPATVTLTATSVADNTKTAQATITVTTGDSVHQH